MDKTFPYGITFPKLHSMELFVVPPMTFYCSVCYGRTSTDNIVVKTQFHSFLLPHFAILLLTGVFMNLLDFM